MQRHNGMNLAKIVTANQPRIINRHKNLKHKIFRRNENIYICINIIQLLDHKLIVNLCVRKQVIFAHVYTYVLTMYLCCLDDGL
jgi:hypothetical protein